MDDPEQHAERRDNCLPATQMFCRRSDLTQLKRINFRSGLLLLLFILLPKAGLGGLLLSDDFSAGMRSHWTVVDEGTVATPSAWSVPAGTDKLRQDRQIRGEGSDPLLQPGTYIVTGETGWTDYSFAVTMKANQIDFSPGAIGVVFAYKDLKNYYRFSMDRRAPGRRLVKVVNGVVTLLASDAVVYDSSHLYTVEVRVVRGRVEVWVDWQLLFDIADGSHTSGKVGLYTWDQAGAEFDDVLVDGQGSSGGCSSPYSILPSKVNIGPSANTGTVSVVAGGGCSWTAKSSNSWVTITSGTEGTGDGVVSYSVQANSTTTARQGSLTIAGLSYAISQDANTVAPGLFSDDFSAGMRSQWTVVDEGTTAAPSSWSVPAGTGKLKQESQIGGETSEPLLQPGTYVITGEPGWTDYSFAVTMRANQTDSTPGALGALFGYRDSKNYYRFSMDRKVAGRRLVKVVNGLVTLLASDTVSYDPSRSYAVEARMVKGRIEIWLDGQRLFTVSDTSHVSGKIGLYTSGQAGAEFDDVLVNGENRVTCSYSIDPPQVRVGSAASTGTVAVTAPSTCRWTAKSNVPWVTITSGSEATGDGVVAYSSVSNGTSTAREGSLSIADLNFAIFQEASSSCTYSIDPLQVTLGTAASTGTVAVTASNTCRWTAKSNNTWMTITSGSEGSGNGVVAYSVQASDTAREGSLTIAGLKFAISQEASTSCANSITPAQIRAAAEGTAGTVAISAGEACHWTVQSSSSWLTITSSAEGTGNGVISYEVEPNVTTGRREASVTIAGRNLTISQEPMVCTYSISPAQVAVGPAASTWTVTVAAPDACAWAAKSNSPWVTITSGGDGSGDGVVAYSIAANDTATARRGSLTIADLGFAISQEPSACTYSITPSQVTVGPDAGTGSVTIAAPDACPWRAKSNNRWVTITSGAEGTGNGVVAYSIQANDTTTARQGSLTIADLNFTISQNSSPCTYSITPAQVRVGATGSTDTVAVSAPESCSWTAKSNSPWVSVTSGAKGSGDGVVSYTVQASDSPTARQGSLTIAGLSFAISQEPSGCTYSISPSRTSLGAAASAGNVSVTAPGTCRWTAKSNSPWVTITSGADGTGDGVVGYSVQASTATAPRQGSLTIAGLNFVVSQDPPCSYSITPSVVTLGSEPAVGTVAVTAPDTCTWTAKSNNSWLTITSGGEGTGDGSVGYSVQGTQTARQGTLTIAGLTFAVSQDNASHQIHVPAGGDLQAAIDSAPPGATITLQPGAIYTGHFFLREKPGAEFITITTNDPTTLPPPGKRITPSYAPKLPKIVTPDSSPAIRTDARAHHYRLVGLEIYPAGFNYDLIRLGSAEATQISQLASDIELDRVYAHGQPKIDAKRGVALNSRATVIRNSYFSDFKAKGQDSQAIGGWNGPGPFDITNNYLEGAGENVMFGGAKPTIDDVVPSDITIRKNHFFKPLKWCYFSDSSDGSRWTVKNLLELKMARRVTIEGNVFENHWEQAQAGFAIVFTVRAVQIADWAVVEDVKFVRNIVRHSGSGVNILGKDYNSRNMGITRRILVKDNVFEDIDPKWKGVGRIFQVLAGAQEITIDHNTVVTENSNSLMMLEGEPIEKLVFTNNIALHGRSGVMGSGKAAGLASLNYYAPGWVFAKNLMVGGVGKQDDYPENNFFTSSYRNIDFIDYSSGDYTLSNTSPYSNAGTDNVDLGADISAVTEATRGAVMP